MVDKKRIAVLGGGNGGHTLAADLTLKGYEVNLCEAPEFKENLSRTLERQVSAFIGHLKAPPAFDTLFGSAVRYP